jgi:hypothetical protein
VKADDASVVIANAELSSRSHHAIADVTIGRASCDSEISRQNGTWKANHNLVANLKVASSADDAANILAAIGSFCACRSDANLAPANGFAIALWFGDEFENLADNQWAG